MSLLPTSTGPICSSMAKPIALIGANLDNRSADKVIDADGLYVLPGGVDVHTHLDMPWRGVRSIDDFSRTARRALWRHHNPC
ncbi:MAG: amidohydrolase family protein [Caldilineaceae bacterium]